MKKKVLFLLTILIIVFSIVQFGLASANTLNDDLTVTNGKNNTEIAQYNEVPDKTAVKTDINNTANATKTIEATNTQPTSVLNATYNENEQTKHFDGIIEDIIYKISLDGKPEDNNSTQTTTTNNDDTNVKTVVSYTNPGIVFSLEFDARALRQIFGGNCTVQGCNIVDKQDEYLKFGVTSKEYKEYLITFFSSYIEKLNSEQAAMFVANKILGMFDNNTTENERKKKFYNDLNGILQALNKNDYVTYITLVRQTIEDVGAKKVYGTPLVIYFDLNAYKVKLLNKYIPFDFNSDGKDEFVPMLAPGAGYLAMDINNDNKITSGLELFGPSTNDGFKELSVFDLNGDGIIDKNDQVYSRLKIWTVDEKGINKLHSIKDVNIESISLKNVKYFEEGKLKILSGNGSELGYVLSRSTIKWENKPTNTNNGNNNNNNNNNNNTNNNNNSTNNNSNNNTNNTTGNQSTNNKPTAVLGANTTNNQNTNTSPTLTPTANINNTTQTVNITTTPNSTKLDNNKDTLVNTTKSSNQTNAKSSTSQGSGSLPKTSGIPAIILYLAGSAGTLAGGTLLLKKRK